ncbi:MAG: hypothetical protein IT445_15975 [Phycisphaeraceae bacterium]|nr:hypothetical protein [Phycisphaeraceae bacterium]
MTRKRLRIKPQPPIDRWAHPTGRRPWWLAIALAGLGLLLAGVAPSRVHDVFRDGSVKISEWRLNQAVTVGGPRRTEPAPSALDQTIVSLLNNQNDGDAQAAFKNDDQTQDDFCPT